MTAWYSNKERGRAYGVWSTAHSIGEGLTFVAVGGLVAALGWRAGFFGPGLLGILVAVATYLLVQDRPRTLGLPTVADWKNDHYEGPAKPAPSSVFRQQLSVLAIPAIWVLALASALNYVTRYAINSWGILYLQEDRGLSLPLAGTMLMVSTVAGIAGAIGFGWVSDKFFHARRPPANLVFGVREIIGLLIIFFGPHSLPVLFVGMVLFGMGMTALVTSLGGLFAVDIAPKRVAGAVMGVIGIFSYVGTAIQEQVSGILIDNGMTMENGVRTYDFGPAIWFWLGASVLSVLLSTALWRTKLRD
jgi:OPA family sugar phosphate sensor protein UhpC-like MFS transporter